MEFKETGLEGVDLSGSGYGRTLGTYMQGNEP
jgi:hypothetical protein